MGKLNEEWNFCAEQDKWESWLKSSILLLMINQLSHTFSSPYVFNFSDLQ